MAYRLQNKLGRMDAKQGFIRLQTGKDRALDSCVPSLGRTPRGYMRILRSKLFVVAAFAWMGISAPSMAVERNADLDRTMALSKQYALTSGSAAIAPEHVMMAILSQASQDDASEHFRTLSAKMGWERGMVGRVTAAIEAGLARSSKAVDAGKLDFDSEAKDLFKRADEKAQSAGAKDTTPAHLLYAMTEKHPDRMAPYLAPLNLSREKFEPLFKSPDAKDGSDEKTSVLESATRNTTERALKRKDSPVRGRHAEIENAIQVMARGKGSKNAPLLVGKEGVQIDEIIEGVALRIESGDVPAHLVGKRIVKLDVGSMSAGTKYRGEMEEKAIQLVRELEKDPNIILYVPNLNELTDAGKTEGSSGLGSILGPSILDGDIQVIGSMQPGQNLNKFSETSLSTAFEIQQIEPTNFQKTVHILRGKKKQLEAQYGDRFKISDAAIKAAADLSTRHVPDVDQPKKAEDALAAGVSLFAQEFSAKAPLAVRDIEADIFMLEEEVEHLRNEPEGSVRNRQLEKAESLLSDLKQRKEQLMEDFNRGHEIKKALAENPADDDRIRLEQELAGIQKKGLHHSEVGVFHIAMGISKATKKPVGGMLEEDRAKVLRLDSELENRVIGQPDAVKALSAAVRVSKSGLNDPNRPIGSYIFLGPTGVGKTELAKVLANVLFDDENALIRIDMSEFMDKGSISKLIGAPPGHVGYEEGGRLTEAVRRRPYVVVLLDEIEKAHREVFDILLQVLDDGRLTDSQGHTISFKNTIIIMTSNVAGDVAARDDLDDDQKKTLIEAEFVRAGYRPELIGRVDKLIPFRSLNSEDMLKILKLNIDKLRRERLEPQGKSLRVSDEAMAKIADLGFDPKFGARPLRKSIFDHAQDPLSMMMLQNDELVGQHGNVAIEMREGEFLYGVDVPKDDGCIELLVKLKKTVPVKKPMEPELPAAGE